MDANIIIKSLSIDLIVSGLFALFRGKTLPLVLKDLTEHRAVMWIAGFLLIIVGGPLVFGANDSLFVIVIGWLIIIKGALYIIVPELFTRLIFKMARPVLVLLSIIVILLGLILYLM